MELEEELQQARIALEGGAIIHSTPDSPEGAALAASVSIEQRIKRRQNAEETLVGLFASNGLTSNRKCNCEEWGAP